MNSLLVIKKPSAVNVCASPGSCPQIAAICLQVCVVVLRRCLHLFYSSDWDICSCGEHLPLVKELSVGPTAPVTLGRGTVVCSALGEGLRYLHIFLSNLFSSPSDAAFASRPVTDALIIRDKKIKRLWLHGERANQNPRSANQFAAIACNLQSISALLLPLKAWRPPRCLALPRIFPKGTSGESSLFPVSADTVHNLPLTKMLLTPVLRQRLVQWRCVAQDGVFS